MNISEAIKYYQEAQKENSKAQEAAKAAAEESRKKWDVIINNSGRFHADKESPEYIAAKEADTIEANARAAANIAKAVKLAASDNVLNVACNALYNAIQENPTKYNKPLHYKVMKANIEEITGKDFFIHISFSTAYLYYRDAAGEREKFSFNLDNENKIIMENLKTRPELTLKEIKKEAKQAQKDAEKLRKAADKLKAEADAAKDKYQSYIKYIMPHLDYSIIKDDYRLF